MMSCCEQNNSHFRERARRADSGLTYLLPGLINRAIRSLWLPITKSLPETRSQYNQGLAHGLFSSLAAKIDTRIYEREPSRGGDIPVLGAVQ